MASAASAHFVSTEQIEKTVQDKDSENLKILNNKRFASADNADRGLNNSADILLSLIQ
jgi:hypothetical protein